MATPKAAPTLPVPTASEHLAFWLRELEDPEFTYVIQGEPGSPIKVGKGDRPERRLAEFQTGNPQELRLLYVVPGGYELERELHYRLRDSKVRGEWFAEPGVQGFLVWMHAYCEHAVEVYRATGRLPEIPKTHRTAKGHYVTRVGANIIHRWRMSQPADNPVTVRYTKPEPLSADEVLERRRKAYIEHDIAKTRTFG